jgi:signal transduction histidine kinase
VLPVVVETVARALKLPYVAVALRQGQGLEIVAAHGTPVAAPILLPLVYQQEPVGQLLLAPRAGSYRLSPADQRLFAVLTRQVAVAVHAAELSAAAVRLTAALQQARTRLVTLREEGRRRLRRDLHDGLGPALACIALQAETARELVRSDPAQAEAALTDLAAQAQAAIADIRRVVYELRPPALDDLGLVGAVRAHACRLSRQDLCIMVDAPEDLPPLPAAVEVAAYRIVQEALTNVVRHARARTCTVRLRLDDSLSAPGAAVDAGGTLCVEVSDDGRGLPTARKAGVGLQSMRERAAELGGSCTIDAAPDGGTRVAARLPVVLPDIPHIPDELAIPQEE